MQRKHMRCGKKKKKKGCADVTNDCRYYRDVFVILILYKGSPGKKILGWWWNWRSSCD